MPSGKQIEFLPNFIGKPVAMKRMAIIGLLPLLISCHSQTVKNGSSSSLSSSSSSSSSSPSDAKYMKFQPAQLVDKEGTGGTALTLLIPDGWKMDGRVIWTTSNAGFPATGQLQVTDPTGDLKFEYFPLLSFFYTQNAWSLQLTPPGTYYGGHLVVTSILETTATIKKYILPYFRKGIQNLEILEDKVLQQEKRESIGTNIFSRNESNLLHIAYTENGKQYEEQIYAMRSIIEGTGMNFNDWYIMNCYGFRAPKGKLQENMKLFQTMLNSIQIDKNWYNKYVQVSKMLMDQGYKNIAAAGQISRIISQTSDEISKTMSDSYWSAQKSNDKVYENYSDYQRGIDTYTDPGTDDTYKLPSGYGNAWKNVKGEYIVSDDPNFNPNDVEKQTWDQLELKK